MFGNIMSVVAAVPQSRNTIEQAEVTNTSSVVAFMDVPGYIADPDLWRTAMSWAEGLRMTPSFGQPLAHSSNGAWATNLSEVEVLARVIFGEAVNSHPQVRGVGWTIMTRTNHTNTRLYGGPTIRGVLTNGAAFEALTGASANTRNAREPDRNSQRWIWATDLAAKMVLAGNLATFETIALRPPGYTNQLYFLQHQEFGQHSSNMSPARNLTLGWQNASGNLWRPWDTVRVERVHSLGWGNSVTGNVFFNMYRQ